MLDQRFPKSARLLKQQDFDNVYQGDTFAADDILVIKAVANEKGVSRMGLSVSRKVGNAVVRNKWKRLIREAFRKQRQNLPKGIDWVVRPRKGADCNYDAIFNSIKKLAVRIERKLGSGIKG